MGTQSHTYMRLRMQRQLRDLHQLPGSIGHHTSLVEAALAAPSAASPTWPASPNNNHQQLPDTQTLGRGGGGGSFQYAIAPPSAAYHSTQVCVPIRLGKKLARRAASVL